MTSPPPPAPPADSMAVWPPDPAGPSARPPLRRSRTDKILGGVSGGLAEYSGIDALLWRVGFVALAFAGGTGVLVYLLLWLLMPSGPPGPARAAGATRAVAGRPPGPRSPIPRITLATALIVLGVLASVDSLTPADPGPHAYLGSALLVVGLGLVAVAFSGARNGRGGLIALGVVLSLALVSTAAEPWEDAEGVGDRTYRPATASSVQPVYRNGVGDLTIDLRRIDAEDLDGPISIAVEHGVGDLEVIFPRDADVELRVENGIGSLDLFDQGSADAGFFPGEGSGSWVDDDEPEFDVRINSGFGDVEVSRA